MQKLYLVKLFENGKNIWEWVGKGVFATICTLQNLAGVSQILATTKIEHRNLIQCKVLGNLLPDP